MFDRNWDATVRNAAFEWLGAQVDTLGDVLPRTLLAQGFMLSGRRVPLVSPQGIFKPQVLSGAPLSITTAPDRYFLGVRPDYVVQVRPDLLRERDGPTLVHGIQALHGTRIAVPRRPTLRPAQDLLETRYRKFRRAGC